MSDGSQQRSLSWDYELRYEYKEGKTRKVDEITKCGLKREGYSMIPFFDSVTVYWGADRDQILF